MAVKADKLDSNLRGVILLCWKWFCRILGTMLRLGQEFIKRVMITDTALSRPHPPPNLTTAESPLPRSHLKNMSFVYVD